jgi:hypothetical protein
LTLVSLSIFKFRVTKWFILEPHNIAKQPALHSLLHFAFFENKGEREAEGRTASQCWLGVLGHCTGKVYTYSNGFPLPKTFWKSLLKLI